ncbi:MAG: hypothetical protein JXA64_05790 [Candidatus Fermentibacteraceae bacterium]|nr:hypothetical protein [Candidatus Fermentibacteraceae bacterium]
MRLILAGLVLVLMAGCGGSGESEPATGGDTDSGGDAAVSDNPLVGRWEVVEVIEGPDYSNTGTFYEFKEDGSMSAGQGVMSIEGTYIVIGDTLRIVLGGVSMDILHSFDDGNLIYDIVNGDQTFLMEPR